MTVDDGDVARPAGTPKPRGEGYLIGPGRSRVDRGRADPGMAHPPLRELETWVSSGLRQKLFVCRLILAKAEFVAMTRCLRSVLYIYRPLEPDRVRNM